MPCSIFIFNFIKSFSGTTNKNPDVGFGVVGKNTFTYFFLSLIAISPEVSAVIKATAHIPFLGY